MSDTGSWPGAFPGDDFGQQQPRRRRQDRQRQNRRKRRSRRTTVVVVISLLVTAGGTYGAYLAVAPVIEGLTAPKDYAGPGSGSVEVVVPEGASGRVIARALADAGVTKTPAAFVDALNADTARGNRIQPGTYELKKEMSAVGALDVLAEPDNRITRIVTIPEGTRTDKALTAIAEQLDLKRKDLVKASESGEIGLPKAARGKLEGFLFPATYEFGPDVSATEALSRMVERGKDAYQELGIPAGKVRATVIKASVIEAEAGNQEYMGMVSRVIDNRLEIDMKLQMDSTVSYATGGTTLSTSDTDRASTSRYNTYRYTGLPQGPINNPGQASLEAALEPTPGEWLYFVTTDPDTGETKFSETLEQHEIYSEEWHAWRERNPGN
ncbi:endolytic transglycosylase MltG [Kineosporia babensis]|uniref:Endolytic murein transglycosylase n=1 Tax=Kineosporia babensis TaxID=499548 RepID=A0A9X1SWS1_9ACTN|nr:endolytic transglycosylase MltG [Kineosporia babensis]